MRIPAFAFLFLFLAFGCLANRAETPGPENLTGAYHDALAGDKSIEVGLINRSPAPAEPENSTTGRNNDPDALAEKVIPSGGIALPVRWKDIGPLTVGSGALNITKFEALLQRNGRPLTAGQRAILENGSDDFIEIDRNNSYFALNLFWAFGLANDNPVLRNFSGSIGSVAVNNLASTGFWSLGDRSGSQLFSSRQMIVLDELQQAIVDEVSQSTYRPCCDNPTSFPDCNHGMAALGLAEWMAYQNASDAEIYGALLAANSYWFPQAYIETAAYLEYQNVSWESVDAKGILSANYSSYSGYQNTRKKLESFPPVVFRGSGCF